MKFLEMKKLLFVLPIHTYNKKEIGKRVGISIQSPRVNMKSGC